MIATRARVAYERKTTLFIMCFAPVTAEQTIVVDFGMDVKARTYIPVDWIRIVIRDAVGHDMPVVFLTPSPLTGGWMCRPTLFPMPIAGATSESVRRTIVKTCGGIFADSCVRIFTTRDTPFLTPEQRTRVRYHDMMPVGPTDYQTMRLHLFQRGIHEALERRACPLAKSHIFHFDPETDAWATLAPRRHRSLVQFWGKKWDQAGAVDEVFDRFAFLGEAHGGTRTSQVFWLKYLTSIELETCPGDWGKGVTGPTPTYFQNFIRDDDPTDSIFKRVFDTVEFRSSSMAFAHIAVKALNLTVPGADCRFWIDEDGQNNEGYNLMRTSFCGILNLVDHPAVFPGEIRHDYMYIRFYRASRWIAAAMAIKFLKLTKPSTAIKPFIDNEIAPLISEIRKTQYSILKEDGRLRDLGVKWLKSLNLGITLPETERPVDALWSPIAHTETDQDVQGSTVQASTAPPVQFAAQPPAQYGFRPTVPVYTQPDRQASFDTPSKLNVNAKPYVPTQKPDVDQGHNDNLSWRSAQAVITKAGKPNIDISAAKKIIYRQIGNPVEKKPVKITAPASIPFQPDVAGSVVPAEAEEAQSGVSVEAKPGLSDEAQPDVCVEVAAFDTEETTKTDEAQPGVSVEVTAVDAEMIIKNDELVESEIPDKVDARATAGTPVVEDTLNTAGDLDPGYDAFFGAADNFKNRFNAKAQAEKTQAEEKAEEPEPVERPVLGDWNVGAPKIDDAEKTATAHHWNDCVTRVDDVEKMATADDDLKDLLAKDWTKKADARQAHVYQPIQSSNTLRLERILNSNTAASPVQESTFTAPTVEIEGTEDIVSETVEKTEEKNIEQSLESNDVHDNATEQGVHDLINSESADGYVTAFEQNDNGSSVKLGDTELAVPALDKIEEADATADSSDPADEFAKIFKNLMETDMAKALALMDNLKVEASTSRVEAVASAEAAHTFVDTEETGMKGATGISPPRSPAGASQSPAIQQMDDHEGSAQGSDKADETEDVDSFVSLNTAPENTFLTEVSDKADNTPAVPVAPAASVTISVTPAASVIPATPGLAEGQDFWSMAGW